MCIGEAASDSLGRSEQDAIAAIALRDHPGHAFSLRGNADGMVWAVLDPRHDGLPRFTICRIDPGLVVMAEIGTAPRLFRTAGDMEAAGVVLRDLATEAAAAESAVSVH